MEKRGKYRNERRVPIYWTFHLIAQLAFTGFQHTHRHSSHSLAALSTVTICWFPTPLGAQLPFTDLQYAYRHSSHSLAPNTLRGTVPIYWLPIPLGTQLPFAGLPMHRGTAPIHSPLHFGQS